MNALHDYVAKQLAGKLKAKRLVVWYDPHREFTSFMAEARAAVPGAVDDVVPIMVADVSHESAGV